VSSPSQIPPFHVAVCSNLYATDTSKKLVITLWHESDSIYCIKATSQVAYYENNLNAGFGCVRYEADEINHFSKKTFIDPTNCMHIPYASMDTNGFQILGPLPEDFSARLATAIQDSVVMSEQEKNAMLTGLRGLAPA
jgi:hypothetical protein